MFEIACRPSPIKKSFTQKTIPNFPRKPGKPPKNPSVTDPVRSYSCGTEYGTFILGKSTTTRGAISWKNPCPEKVVVFFPKNMTGKRVPVEVFQ